MKVFVVSRYWTALERFARGETSWPEGTPSTFLPWLQYVKKGHAVDVFMPLDGGTSQVIDFHGCKLHVIPRPRLLQNRKWFFPMNRLYLLVDSILIYLSVVKVAREHGHPDVVYSYRIDFSFLGWFLAKRFKSVFVKRLFGTWAYWNWRHNFGLAKKCSAIFEFLRWLWPSDMIIITNDGTQGNKVAKLLRIPESRFRCWFNGVDKKQLPDKQQSLALRASLGLTEKHFVLMCLSRLADWKRQDRVVRAMPIILETIPNARLVIVGDGPERHNLEKLVGELNIKSYVQFTGMVEHSKTRDIIGIADVFLQTNDLSCLGNTLLEAMICGCAIVTWDVGGTKDVIQDGKTGCLMQNAEPETISKTVIGLAKDTENRSRLAFGARKFAEDHLQSWDERCDMEMALVEKLYNERVMKC